MKKPGFRVTLANVYAVATSLLCLVAASSCTSPTPEPDMTLEQQIRDLAALGIPLSDGVDEAQLLTFYTRAELEEVPHRLLAETLGHALEEPPWTPLAPALWMLDLECVDDHGSIVSVLERLERMTGAAVGLEAIEDHVSVFPEGGHATIWVSFELGGSRTRWDLVPDEDWLDIGVLSRYAALLRRSGSSLELFMATDRDEYGQAVFLAALTPAHQAAFSELTGIAMEPVP